MLKGPLRLDPLRLLTLLLVLVYAATGVSSPLITLFLEDIGASYRQIAVILTAFAVAALLGNALWGSLADRLGRHKPVLASGLFGLALAYIMLSLAPAASWALPIRLLEGFSLAAYLTSSLALIGNALAAGGRRGARMGTYRGLGSLAFALGAVAGGLLASSFSLRLALGLCAGLYALAAIGALALREHAPEAEADSTAKEAPRSRLPRRFLVGVGLWTAALAASASMWPNFMLTLGYGPATISGLWGLTALIELPAMMLAGRLADAFGRAPVLAFGGFGVALVMLGYIALARALLPLVGVQVLRGLAYAGYTVSAMTFTAERGDRRTRGKTSGLFNAASSAGQVLGLMLGGTLVEARGFESLFAACALIASCSGALFLSLRARPTPPPEVTTISKEVP